MTRPPWISTSYRAARTRRAPIAEAAPRPARNSRLVNTEGIIVTAEPMRSRSSISAPARRAGRFAVDHSLVLPAGVAIALVWANTSAASYTSFARALDFPVNDIGMVFFFALAAKEVVEATCPGGALRMSAALAAVFVIRRRQTRVFWPYVAAGGALSWTALFWGGFHPALALVPIMPFVPHATRDPGLFVDAPAGEHDPLSEFEHRFKYPVQAVLFLFGLVNAGVVITAIGPGTWAVLVAIATGKPLGIGLAVAGAALAGLRLPQRLGWSDIVVVGCAAGIGFTVALFFATAAFPPGRYLDETKLGALLSVGSAGVALAVAAILRVGRFRASQAARL